jgi:hypothetical protein
MTLWMHLLGIRLSSSGFVSVPTAARRGLGDRRFGSMAAARRRAGGFNRRFRRARPCDVVLAVSRQPRFT